jgi:hypothetical protein
MQEIRSLIKNECCNYDSGNCVRLDNGFAHKCFQASCETMCCDWFTEAVLPLNKELEASVSNKTQQSTKKGKSIKDGTEQRKKICGVCGKSFSARARNARFCAGCAEKRTKNSNTTSQRKRRSLNEK